MKVILKNQKSPGRWCALYDQCREYWNRQIVQHYELKFHSAEHIQLYSAKSDAYIMRWFLVVVRVPWEMQIKPVTKDTCELVCLIGADYPNPFLQVAAFINGLGGMFLKKHLKKECKTFAKDIEDKFRLKRNNQTYKTEYR